MGESQYRGLARDSPRTTKVHIHGQGWDLGLKHAGLEQEYTLSLTGKRSQDSLSPCPVQFLQALSLCVKAGPRGRGLDSVSVAVSLPAMWDHL